MLTLPIICQSDSNFHEQFNNRYSIYVADPYEYKEPDFSLIQKLAEDLGAVNPTVVRSEGEFYTHTYLTADKFLSVQAQLDKAFDKQDFQVEEKVNDTEIAYLIEVKHDSCFHGYPKSFWKKEDHKRWLTPESSSDFDCWLDISFHKKRKTMINQSIETAQKLVEFYQAQLELTPQFKCLETAKNNLAKLKDREREDYWGDKTISIVTNEDKHNIPDSTYEFFCNRPKE